MVAILVAVGLITAGCGWKPGGPASAPPDSCADSDGPSADTVQHAIIAEPSAVPGSTWTEIGRGHTHDCRLYWVQIAPSSATAVSPNQLLFFDHNTPLGSPTTNPKPYTTVLTPGEDTVTVQYQWQKGGDTPERPTGIGTVRYQIGPDGKLKALDPIPNQ
ncbi:LppP/LprE family lipoprotein [Mycobacterium talmoniae]|nr:MULTISPECIES: LppP/LprE family lipoprotein [Mycobacterium]OHU85942.1 hypothetical protein BKN37_26325 [Mycobacterium talmoniae]TDH49635.1 LppP/LprE family lipoprotein [Mycobacterium eburneum]